jgi:maleamate amidohydrolase
MSFEPATNYAGVFDGRVGFGQRPALLLVDFVTAYTTPGMPLYAPAVVDAVRQTLPLLALARKRNIPVISTRVAYTPRALEGGHFVRKVPALQAFLPGGKGGSIVEELAPDTNDTVLVKAYASAFFGTPLSSLLTSQGVDTLLLTGCSTSGCIRATAVDGMQHGFRVIVPRECVGDRAPGPHEANLFDIHAKYGDVVSQQDVLRYLEGLPR